MSLATIFQTSPPGFENVQYGSNIVMLIAIVLVIIGLLVAFAGRIVWKHVMSFIGATIGGIFGFVLGTAVGGVLIGLIAGILGAVVGSALFVFLAKVGLGVVAGVFAYVIGLAFTDSQVAGLVLAVIAFALTIAFIETAIGIVTAIVGGLLVGIGLLWTDEFDMYVVVIGMLAVMAFGAAIQLAGLKKEEERRKRAHVGGTVVASTVAAPVAPRVPGRSCPRCSGQMRYVPQYNRYCCDTCQRYE
jgi:hypothetical protein